MNPEQLTIHFRTIFPTPAGQAAHCRQNLGTFFCCGGDGSLARISKTHIMLYTHDPEMVIFGAAAIAKNKTIT